MQRRGLAVVILLLGVGLGYWWWGRKSPGHTTKPAAMAAEPTAADSSAAPLAAPATHLVSGRVVDAKGQAVANAMVVVEADHEQETPRTMVANASGEFEFRDVLGERATVTASAQAYIGSSQDVALGATSVGLTLTLATGSFAVTGVVRDVSGGPVAGALVAAASPDQVNVRSFALSDGNGSYAVAVAPGLVALSASHNEYVPTNITLMVTAPLQHDLRLVPGASIEGLVVTAEGKTPVAGATVRAVHGDGAMAGQRKMAKTNAEGRYTLTGLAPGNHQLSAVAGAKRTVAPRTVGVGIAQTATGIDLQLATGYQLRGRVVGTSGAPEPNAHVTLVSFGDQLEAASDAKGEFEFSSISPGAGTLFASREHDGKTEHSELMRVDVGPSMPADRVVLVLNQTAQVIRGRVEPAAVARIQIQKSGGNILRMPWSITTNPDGTFELAHEEPASYRFVAQTKTARGQVAVDIGAVADREVVIALTKAASVAGTVVDLQGQPIGNATVMASANGESVETIIVNGRITSGEQAMTDGGGNFLLTGLAAGSYALTVLDRGVPMDGKAKPVTVKLTEGEAKTGVVLKVKRATGTIAGMVTDEAGRPVEDAYVTATLDSMALATGGGGGDDDDGDDNGASNGRRRSSRTSISDDDSSEGAPSQTVLTDAQGKFEFRQLPPGPYRVIAEADAGLARGVAASLVDQAPITIRLAKLGTIRGRVSLAGKAVATFSAGLSGVPPRFMQIVDAGGEFEFARVDPGDYEVTVVSANGEGRARVQVTGGQVANAEIALASNGYITGKFVDKLGKPVAGRPVLTVEDRQDGNVQVSMNGDSLPATTGSDGSFRVPSPPGRRIVLVMGEQPSLKAGVMVSAGKTTDLGTITDGDEPPPSKPGAGSGSGSGQSGGPASGSGSAAGSGGN